MALRHCTGTRPNYLPKYEPEVYRLCVLLRWMGLTTAAIARQLRLSGTPLSTNHINKWVNRPAPKRGFGGRSENTTMPCMTAS